MPISIADKIITYKNWAEKIQNNFEKLFWIKRDPSTQDPDYKLINRRGIYKDSYNASETWRDYQLRPNFPMAMVVVSKHTVTLHLTWIFLHYLITNFFFFFFANVYHQKTCKLVFSFLSLGSGIIHTRKCLACSESCWQCVARTIGYEDFGSHVSNCCLLIHCLRTEWVHLVWSYIIF